MNKLFFSLIAMMLPLIAGADDSGKCGDNLTWTYVEATKTLTISGTGVMSDYNPITAVKKKAPWRDLNVEKLILENGITEIGQNAFRTCNITAVNIPASVTKIGTNAFMGCKLENIVANNSSTSIVYYENGEHYYPFSDNTFMHAMLYIPEGTWSDYVYKGSWWRFYNIREISTNISMLSSSQVYTLMNTSDFGYAVYDETTNKIKMAKAFYSIDENEVNNCWQVQSQSGKNYLYNLGAQKYASVSVDGNITLSAYPVEITITEGENGLILGADTNHRWGFVKSQGQSNPTSINTNIHYDTTDRIYYSLDGQQFKAPQKGINIVRYKDGSTKKVIIK